MSPAMLDHSDNRRGSRRVAVPGAWRAELELGWRRVLANSGASGGDGVTVDAFARRADAELEQLAAELEIGRYRPGKLRRVSIPKSGGGVRVLSIPAVRDRVVQTALLFRLGPSLDRRQSALSFAYRPARNVAQAVTAVSAGHRSGLVWTVETDVSAYFDSIGHRRLMQDLAIWIDDEVALRLIALWLRSFSSAGRGIPQGAPIAPLLANLYLHPIDRLMSAAGFVTIRYADDAVILAPNKAAARAALALFDRLLRQRGLAPKQEKTRILSPGTEFHFLGQTLSAPSILPGAG